MFTKCEMRKSGMSYEGPLQSNVSLDSDLLHHRGLNTEVDVLILLVNVNKIM